MSATVTIVCLFTPKLYIVLLHPEKNIRQSMMSSSKYGQSGKNSSIVAANKQSKINENGNDNLELKFDFRTYQVCCRGYKLISDLKPSI